MKKKRLIVFLIPVLLMFVFSGSVMAIDTESDKAVELTTAASTPVAVTATIKAAAKAKKHQFLDEIGLPRSEWLSLADEWIFSEQGRQVFKRYYLDGITAERLAEEIDRTPRQVREIAAQTKKTILSKIEIS